MCLFILKFLLPFLSLFHFYRFSIFRFSEQKLRPLYFHPYGRYRFFPLLLKIEATSTVRRTPVQFLIGVNYFRRGLSSGTLGHFTGNKRYLSFWWSVCCTPEPTERSAFLTRRIELLRDVSSPAHPTPHERDRG